MHILPLESLPGYSSLAKAFLRGDTFVRDHFRVAQSGVVDTQYREAIVSAIETSMSSLTMSIQQELALERFRQGARSIVTGQQVGFLGGPMYTVCKIATAVGRVNHHTIQSVPAAAVFWIEDNDHDLEEAATADLYHREHGSVRIDARDYSSYRERQSVASCCFDDRVLSLGRDIARRVDGDDEGSEDLIRMISSVYVPGRSWSDAFMDLMQRWFAEHGVLFVKASVIRSMGLMSDVIERDLNQGDSHASLVQKSTQAIVSHGYQAQITASGVNSFYHDDHDVRHKINVGESGVTAPNGSGGIIDTDSLHAMIQSNPERFSPSVVLRPLIQDILLETMEFVVGPGELSYMAQLTDLYVHYGVKMPDLVPRSGVTFLSSRIERLMSKEGHTTEYFLHPWQDISEQYVKSGVDASLLQSIEHSRREIALFCNEIHQRSEEFDKSLSGAVGSMKNAMEKELSNLERKVRTSAKRKQEESLKRAQEIYLFIFPEEKLQERFFVPISLSKVAGESTVGSVIDILRIHPTSHHFVLDESALRTTQS